MQSSKRSVDAVAAPSTENFERRRSKLDNVDAVNQKTHVCTTHIQVMKTAGQKRKHRAKVLVAAPSNAALDEIVLRLLAAGLRDEAGEPYSPTIVRAGLNAHHSVAGVTMDALVTQRMTSMARGGVSSAARAGSTGMERDRIRTAILDEAAIVRRRPAASMGNSSLYTIPRTLTTGFGTDKPLPCVWSQ
jgi:hypothetical protein